MKLLLAVISKDDAEETLKKLAENKISAAQIASNGTGFFVPGNSTLLVVAQDHQEDEVIDMIRETAGTVRRRGTDSYDPTSIFSGIEEGGGFVAVLDGQRLISL